MAPHRGQSMLLPAAQQSAVGRRRMPHRNDFFHMAKGQEMQTIAN